MWRLDESLNVLLDGIEPAVLALGPHATETTHHFYAIETNDGCASFIPVFHTCLSSFLWLKSNEKFLDVKKRFLVFAPL